MPTPGSTENSAAKGTKPLSVVWRHYEAVTSSETGKKVAKCNYCQKTLYPHCDRMKKHLLACATLRSVDPEGEKRKELIAEVGEEKYGKNDSNKRKRHDSSVTSDSDSDLNNELQLSLLTKLVKLKESKSNTSLSKKPLSKFTDEDFDRETKELTVKKLRLDIKLKEEQNRLYAKLGKGVGKLMKLVDFVLENQGNVTVYAPGQDDVGVGQGSILQTAFESTLHENNKDSLIG